MWLLTLVLPFQGAALGVFAAEGPAHLHRATSARPLVLNDVRRWKIAPAIEPLSFAPLTHGHAGGSPQRHHHARSDASVVAANDDVPDTDEAVGASGVSLLALIPELAVGGVAERVAAARIAAPVVLRTRSVAPLDRPPQACA